MSETTNTTDHTFHCFFCEHESDCHGVVPTETTYGFECVDKAACERRQKRNKILAEMQVMALTPHIHPVDKVSRTVVALCGFFFGCIITMGLAYLLFGI